jgi:Fe-S-cluster containining protein
MATNKLERQVERSSFFTHTALSKQADRINELASFLYGLIDVLIKKGITIPEELSKAAEDVRAEMFEKGEHTHAGVGLRIDKKNEPPFVPVNCAERMHICQAVCCRLQFALSVPEIESGQIKWDLGKPYFIRHEASGYCTHLHAQKKCCTVYDNRPQVCKKYSCANDTRIWKDFEKMELNHVFINEILKEEKPALMQIS